MIHIVLSVGCGGVTELSAVLSGRMVSGVLLLETGCNQKITGVNAVAYLEELRIYTGWDIVYVMCDSWNEALEMLEEKEVDLVGYAQYSEERAEVFEFASLSSGYTYGCLFVEKDSSMAFEDFEGMKDMTFGVVESYVRKGEFLEYLDRNGYVLRQRKGLSGNGETGKSGHHQSVYEYFLYGL